MIRFYSFLKNVPQFLFAILIAIAVFAPAKAEGKANKQIRVGIWENNPLVYVGASNKAMGLFPVVVDYIAEKEAWDIVYVQGNFPELMEELKKNTIDALLSVSVTEKRKEHYIFPQEDIFSNWGVVLVPEKSKISSMLDLEGKIIAAMDKAVYTDSAGGISDLLRDFNLPAKITLLKGYSEAMRAVANGDADCAVVNRIVAQRQAQKFSLKHSGIIFKPVGTRIAFSKNNPQSTFWAKTIDRHMVDLRSDTSSPYHIALNAAQGGMANNKQKFFKIVLLGLVVATCISLLLFGWTRVLRRMVNQATEDQEEHAVKLEVMNKDLKKSKEKQKKNNRLLRSIMDNTLQLQGILTPDGKVMDVNATALKLINASMDSVINCYFWDTPWWNHDPALSEKVRHAVGKAANGELVRFEAVHYDKFGELHQVDVSLKSVNDERGEVIYLLAEGHDITERKKAEKELIKEQTFTENVVNSMPGIFYTFNEKQHLVKWNKNLENLLGKSTAEIVQNGVHLLDPIPNEEKERVVKALQQAQRTGENLSLEANIMSKDGSKVPMFLTAHQIYIGNEKYLLGVGIDITEKKKLEKELQQAHKMEAIGTLAGGIAHDFNNILAAILGYTDIVMDDLPPGSSIASDLNQVLNAGNRAKELVKQILAFSRQSDQELRPVQIHLIVKEALKLLRSSIPTTIEIRQDIDPQSGTVFSDATQIHQITMNLCTNAYHAMRETGGIIDVIMRPIQIEEEDNKVNNFHLAPGPYVELTVSDSGGGIDRNIIDKIFDPYFTTKKKGEGTGLGLSVVHGIVKSYGGHITAYSKPGEGTTFRLFLPQIIADITSEKTETTEIYPTGNERALIVDDEEVLVNMVQKMLTSLGYKVTALTSSAMALKTFKEDPNGFDFIITDMTMPNMNGAELIQRIRVISPDIPIFLCSGYCELIDKERSSTLSIQKYIMKPILKRSLAEAVREVLDEGNS